MNYQLQLKGISKTFSSQKVLDNISLNFKSSTIYALLGENGAGKSTLSSIIYGHLPLNSGEIFWENEPISIDSPLKAKQLGISMLFQDFCLFESFSVLENIALSIDYKISLKRLRKRVLHISDTYDLDINHKAIIRDLSAGEKQKVEIVRCLLQDPKFLIFDEPTSVLTSLEVKKLFSILKKLKEDGKCILFISHKLDEVKQICDIGIILKKGKIVNSNFSIKDTSISTMAYQMMGLNIKPYSKHKKYKNQKTILKLSNNSYNLELKKSNILGIAGISGNGQDELMATLAGEILINSDSLTYQNKSIGHWDINKRREEGIVFLPTQKFNMSILPKMSLQENALLGIGNKKDFIKNGLIKYKALKKASQYIIKTFKVKPPHIKNLANSLSGGNLHKFVIGRSIYSNPKVLFVSNPTCGADVESAIFIRDAILELRESGACVLVLSEDLDELFSICDEISVINNNILTKAYSVDKLDVNTINSMMTSKNTKNMG